MPERRSAIPAWAWIVGAVLVIVSVFIGYRMVQTQQHLAAAQSELENAKQAVDNANAERNELQTKLADATSEVRSAQSVLAETKSVLEAAQSETERATQADHTVQQSLLRPASHLRQVVPRIEPKPHRSRGINPRVRQVLREPLRHSILDPALVIRPRREHVPRVP